MLVFTVRVCKLACWICVSVLQYICVWMCVCVLGGSVGLNGLCEVAADRSHPSHSPLWCILEKKPAGEQNPWSTRRTYVYTSRLCSTLVSPSGHLFWGRVKSLPPASPSWSGWHLCVPCWPGAAAVPPWPLLPALTCLPRQIYAPSR